MPTTAARVAIRVTKANGLRTPEQRAGVVYVGRQWAGWPESPWGNPFRSKAGFSAVKAFESHFVGRPWNDIAAALAALWEETGHGAKPLACWCIDATAGDGLPEVCHAQVLARLLTRFLESEAR